MQLTGKELKGNQILAPFSDAIEKMEQGSEMELEFEAQGFGRCIDTYEVGKGCFHGARIRRLENREGEKQFAVRFDFRSN
ncbi:MAG: hypothetical protein MI784_04285 [Cytophagales bacterium]|nr:hypothetical protein [Cytophagales bacterium]